MRSILGAHEMATWLAGNSRVRACYATQWARFLTGGDSTVCAAERRFIETGDLQGLLVDLVTSDELAEARGDRFDDFVFPDATDGRPDVAALRALVERARRESREADRNEDTLAALERYQNAAQSILDRLERAP